MENKLGQEPAFAKSAYVSNEGSVDPPQEGMSKRFYAACAAMQGMLSNPAFATTRDKPVNIVKMACGIADELLKQENL